MTITQAGGDCGPRPLCFVRGQRQQQPNFVPSFIFNTTTGNWVAPLQQTRPAGRGTAVYRQASWRGGCTLAFGSARPLCRPSSYVSNRHRFPNCQYYLVTHHSLAQRLRRATPSSRSGSGSRAIAAPRDGRRVPGCRAAEVGDRFGRQMFVVAAVGGNGIPPSDRAAVFDSIRPAKSLTPGPRGCASRAGRRASRTPSARTGSPPGSGLATPPRRAPRPPSPPR